MSLFRYSNCRDFRYPRSSKDRRFGNSSNLCMCRMAHDNAMIASLAQTEPKPLRTARCFADIEHEIESFTPNCHF